MADFLAIFPRGQRSARALALVLAVPLIIAAMVAWPTTRAGAETTVIVDSSFDNENTSNQFINITTLLGPEPIAGAAGVVVPGGITDFLTGVNSSNNIVNVTDIPSGGVVGNFTVVGGFNSNSTFNGGNVSNNTVNVNATGAINGSVVGGVSNVSGSSVYNNTVNLINGTVDTEVIGGLQSENGQAFENKVYIKNGTVGDSVYGGVAINGTANLNNVTIDNGTLSGSVFGGDGASASNNTVLINNTNAIKDIYGGRALGYNVTGTNNLYVISEYNIVNITGASNITGKVYGGGLTNDTGFEPQNGTVQHNTVNINNSGGIISEVYGGEANGGLGGSIYNNTVNFINGNATLVFGGHAGHNFTGNVSENKVSVTGGNITNISGAYIGDNGHGGEVRENTVSFSNANATNIYGALAGNNVSNNLINNSVEILSGNVSGSVYGSAAGDDFSADALDNFVNVAGGNITGNIYGVSVGANATGLINGTKVSFSNANVSNIYGVDVGDNSSATISDSYVEVSSGNVSGSIYGANIGANYTGDALNNFVNVTGGNITGDIYGVFAGANATGLINGSKVSFANADVTSIVGAYVGDNSSANISYSLVEVTSGNVTNVTGGLAGANYTGNLTYNIVNITGGNVSGTIIGGAIGQDSIGSLVSFNEVYFTSPYNATDIYGGFAADNSTHNVTYNKVVVKDGNVTGNVTGGRSSLGQADSNIVEITNSFELDNVFGGYSVNSSASNNTIILENVNISGSVYGGYSEDVSIDTNNNNSVVLRGANILGDIIGTTGVNNNLTLESGVNVVNGSVDINGTLRVIAGENTLNRTIVNGNLIIEDGKTTFKDATNVYDNVTISGGENEFLSDLNLTVGNIDVTGGNNTFNNVNLTVGNISIAGLKNIYKGNVTANKFELNGGSHYFNSTITQRISTNDPVIVGGNSALYFGDGAADVIFDQSLSVRSGSSINLVNDANLTINDAAGLELGGTVNVGLHGLEIFGNVSLNNGSTFQFDSNSTTGQQGYAYIVGDFNIDNPSADILNIEATTPTDINMSDYIIGFDSTGASNLVEDNLYSPIFNFVLEPITGGTGIFIDGYKSVGQIIDQAGMDVDSFTYNQEQLISLSDEIIDDIDSGLGGSNLVDLDVALNTRVNDAVQTGNRAIVDRVLNEMTGEHILAVYRAVVDTTIKAQGVVFKRLDRIHESLTSVPPAAGSADTFNRAWVGGFGSWARQKDRDRIDGYDYNSGGFSLGYDRRAEGLPGLRFGLVTSFSFGKIESNDGFSTIDVDTAGVGIYGSYILDNGVFFDANVAYAHSSNDSKLLTWGGGYKSGEFDIDTWQIGARVGKIFDFGTLKFTPTVGLRYISVEQDAFAERQINTTSLPNYFAKKSDHIVEIPILLKLNGSFETGSGKIIPEFRAGYTFVAQRPDRDQNVGLTLPNGWQYNTRMNPHGIKAARGSFQLGAGIKYEINDQVDIFVNYDLDAASKFVSHNAALGIGFNF
ncbi:MAG: autotransporter domain-containing protein [Deltaproteobacteria bacterium]|jgi:uncharacterized protein with beta-barrel porin domain|nr:autotransporter domain-containing protein [Deltaproteobacteria bacterium]